MDITAYTSFDDIRAVLGVSIDELEDPTISLPVYALNLEAELRDISPQLPSDLEAVRGKEPSLRTSDETWLLQMGQLFVTYSVANQLSSAMPMFSPKEISDSKASLSRFSMNPFTETIKRVKEQFETTKSRLTAAYDVVKANSGTKVRPAYMVVSRPGRDPVTGT